MRPKKRRTYTSSDLVKIFAKAHGFEDKLLAFEAKKLLAEYLTPPLLGEIRKIDYKNKKLTIAINSPILKNDFRFRKQFYLEKLNEAFGEETFDEIIIM